MRLRVAGRLGGCGVHRQSEQSNRPILLFPVPLVFPCQGSLRLHPSQLARNTYGLAAHDTYI